MRRRLAVLALTGLLAACSTTPRQQTGGGYYQDDGPPASTIANLDHIPDAVPRREPLSATGNAPYTALGHTYYPLSSAQGFHQRGYASWYGRKYHGRRTSSGERYDMFAMTAAHPTLPLPSYVRVTNLGNGRSVVVKVNDRGPFLNNRIIDLSYAAAYRLGIVADGTGKVEVDGVTPATPAPVTATEGPLRVYLQVGAFAHYRNAQRLRARLQSAGVGPISVRVVQREDRALQQVRVGPLASQTEVQREVDAIGRALAVTPAVVYQ